MQYHTALFRTGVEPTTLSFIQGWDGTLGFMHATQAPKLSDTLCRCEANTPGLLPSSEASFGPRASACWLQEGFLISSALRVRVLFAAVSRDPSAAVPACSVTFWRGHVSAVTLTPGCALLGNPSRRGRVTGATCSS